MCKKAQNNLYLKLLVLLFIISQAPLIGYPSGQDGMGPSCPLGISRLILQKKIS